MLAHYLRRWPNIISTLVQSLVFAGKYCPLSLITIVNRNPTAANENKKQYRNILSREAFVFRSTLRREHQADEEVSIHTENILNGDELLSFWISWEHGLIQVGYGSVLARDRFMHWQDPHPRSVHAVTFASGWGYEAHWEVDSYSGKSHFITCKSVLVQCWAGVTHISPILNQHRLNAFW